MRLIGVRGGVVDVAGQQGEAAVDILLLLVCVQCRLRQARLLVLEAGTSGGCFPKNNKCGHWTSMECDRINPTWARPCSVVIPMGSAPAICGHHLRVSDGDGWASSAAVRTACERSVAATQACNFFYSSAESRREHATQHAERLAGTRVGVSRTQ